MTTNFKCESLTDYENMCDFGECVTLARSLHVTNHAEWWELTLKPSNPARKAWMKVFLNLDSVLQNRGSGVTDPEIVRTFYKYYNEFRVYYNIVRPLIQNLACPHFFRPLGAGTNCSQASLVHTFGGNMKGVDQNRRLAVVIQQMLTTNSAHRNSLIESDTDPIQGAATQIPLSHRYNFNTLILEIPDSKAQLLTFNWDVVFQVAVACYALELSQLNHNNLTVDCVHVYNSPTSETYYLINNFCYYLRSKHRAYLYDFEDATSPRLRESESFQPLKDFVMFLRDYVARFVVDSLKAGVIQQLAEVLVNEEVSDTTPNWTIDDYNQTFRVPEAKIAGGARKPKKRVQVNKVREMRSQLHNGITIEPLAWELLVQHSFFQSLENIIYRLCFKCKRCKLVERIPENKRVYTLHPEMFTAKGEMVPYENHQYALLHYLYYIPSVKELDTLIKVRQSEITKLEQQLAL